MNVNDMDLSEDELKVPCKIKAIFDKQIELMSKYHTIEKRNGLLQTDNPIVDLHDRFGQARLKDFAWRVTEELGEATEALEIHPEDETHFQEELIDALHFYVELCLISGMNYKDVVTFFNSAAKLPTQAHSSDLMEGLYYEWKTEYLNKGSQLVEEANYKVIQYLSNSMNCLKNKPWKESHMLTDLPKYYLNLYRGFEAMMQALFNAGMSQTEVYVMYCLKNKVNKFRQRSKY